MTNKLNCNIHKIFNVENYFKIHRNTSITIAMLELILTSPHVEDYQNKKTINLS